MQYSQKKNKKIIPIGTIKKRYQHLKINLILLLVQLSVKDILNYHKTFNFLKLCLIESYLYNYYTKNK